MIFHFTVLFFSLIFGVGLELVAKSSILASWSWYLFSIVPLLVISLIASKRLTNRFSDAFIPILLSLSSPTLLSLIDNQNERQVFVALSVLMYYFALLGNYRLRHAPTDKTGEAFLNTAAMAALFFFFAGLDGFYLNFSFPLWGLMLLYFLGAALTSYETFVSVDRSERRRVILYSVLLGLIMGELAWVMSLWPFGYLTTGALGTIFFFIIWDISFDAFRQALSLRKAALRILFFLGLIVLLLYSTPWRILV
ncbi:MAG: hypothetical protein KBA91_00595 [Candidatus Moranbacteria bacterium]|jgi:hypothetical protein|nr:hypothetical protein [Candidatus Moranbacteria bacterium]